MYTVFFNNVLHFFLDKWKKCQIHSPGLLTPSRETHLGLWVLCMRVKRRQPAHQRSFPDGSSRSVFDYANMWMLCHDPNIA